MNHVSAKRAAQTRVSVIFPTSGNTQFMHLVRSCYVNLPCEEDVY